MYPGSVDCINQEPGNLVDGYQDRTRKLGTKGWIHGMV